jgi:hypothetical protein
MPNYNASASGVASRFTAQGNPAEPLAPKPTSTKHYQRVWEVLQRLPRPAAYIREAVRRCMVQDGLLDP